ncbi:hypothetical protein [Curtobacterium luteum]|uniref:Uncharacterized protein n=1 Tax=Curtobacterium luteum TaxID=33881 RepID=A0A175RFP0_9MICO|nr:hypothetical protein [Curtobacterium luteum]KTR02657.1 hypothetical protein NS184_15410 [Curtobacterium luteum]
MSATKHTAAIKPGATVDCIIGAQFLPNGLGSPMAVDGRSDGTVLGQNDFGTWDVMWPTGETYSYEAALLHVK